MVALKDLAERQIEIGKNKFIKTEEDLNPNMKFVNNQVFLQLDQNEERLSFNSKHKKISVGLTR